MTTFYPHVCHFSSLDSTIFALKEVNLVSSVRKKVEILQFLIE